MASLSLFPYLPVTPSCRTVCLPFFSTNSSCKVCSTTKTASFQCMVAINNVTKTPNQSPYPPNFWDYDHLKSLTTHDYTEEKYGTQVEKLKDEMKDLINAEMEVPLSKLELIDSVQRLGLQYQFEKEINKAVGVIYNHDSNASDDLYATALRFRLLRQHGYDVSQGVFEKFKDGKGSFKASLSEDVKGLLSLYEASFLGFEDENIIEEAKAFAEVNLKKIVNSKGNYLSLEMETKVKRTLDMPIHWRLTRLEAGWFIDTYEKQQNMNPTLLRLAKLDYNILQSIYRKEANQVVSWWVDELGIESMAVVLRDRVMEHYFFVNCMLSGPKYISFRKMATKIACFIVCLDDLYDSYGSLEELQLFTDFVDRWDISEIDKLPYNTRTVLLALFNTTNEMGYWALKEHGINIIPYFSKQWADLCKAFLKEAEWSHTGYQPTLDEYLEIALVSSSGPLMLFCSYFGTAEKISREALIYIEKLPTTMQCSSVIFRLTNDLTISPGKVREDVNAIHCYMNDTGATEEVARQYIDGLVHNTWKTMNQNTIMHQHYPDNLSEPFLSAIPNLARTSQCVYQHGDGLSIPNSWTNDYLNALLFQPFSL